MVWLSRTHGLAAAGRLQRGGRSLVATFVLRPRRALDLAEHAPTERRREGPAHPVRPPLARETASEPPPQQVH